MLSNYKQIFITFTFVPMTTFNVVRFIVALGKVQQEI